MFLIAFIISLAINFQFQVHRIFSSSATEFHLSNRTYCASLSLAPKIRRKKKHTIRDSSADRRCLMKYVSQFFFHAIKIRVFEGDNEEFWCFIGDVKEKFD